MPLRHGVVAGAAPGVAAEDALEGEPEAFEGAVFAEGLKGVLRACGGEAAGGRFQRGDTQLIEFYQQDD